VSNFQTSLGCQFRESLFGAPGAEQRDALRSESSFGERHELLKRCIARIAKKFDRSG
jgi:hypothetical protein